MNIIFIGVSFYIVIQFVFGMLISHKSDNEADFILAGRKIGPLLGTLTVFATWFGAESVIGAAGNIYSNGLSGSSSDPFGYGLCLIVLGAVFAIPLWRRQYLTFGDFFRERFSSKVEKLFVLLVVPSSLFWAAAQVRAFGQIVSAITQIDVELAIAGAACLITIYTMVGGMRATAITDLIQGVVLILGLIILLVIIVNAAGGWSVSWQQIPAERIWFNDTDTSILQIIEKWAVPICGATLAAESIARILAMRSENTARMAAVGGGLLYIVIGLVPFYLGLIGPELISDLDDSEQIIPLLAEQYLSTFLYVIFCGALVSAILSTVDSALLAAAALISHNVIVPLKKNANDKDKIKLARASVVGLGLLAYLFATTASGVHELIWTAVSFGTAGIFVVGTMGLFTRIGGEITAFITLIIGAGVWAIGEFVVGWETPFIYALSAAFLSYLLTAKFEKTEYIRLVY